MPRLIRYPDSRLPPGKSVIRLLSIDRKVKSSIVGETKQVVLDSKECPKFTTMSYVWGDRKADYRIKVMVNGVRFPVAPSAGPVLELIRDHTDFKAVQWIWMDAICINQKDPMEKSSQVDIMGSIYKTSAMTVVWLGKAEKETKTAMGFMKKLLPAGSALEMVYRSRKIRQMPRGLGTPEEWTSLIRFFSLAWWRRVWTLQEFIISKKLKFYWGDTAISRAGLKAVIKVIWLCLPVKQFKFDVLKPAWNRRRLHQWYQQEHAVGKKSLLAWMSYHSDSELSDKRDRIYGVLGLVNETDKKLIGTPNYGDDNNVLECYHRLVMSWVQTHKSLDIICFATLFNSQQPGNLFHEHALPSWVPDWRAAVDTFVVPLLVSQSGKTAIGNFGPIKGQEANSSCSIYAASGDQGPRVGSWTIPHQLPCQGIFIDIIDGFGGMPKTPKHPESLGNQSNSQNNIGPPPSTRKNGSSTDEQLLNDIVRCLVLDRGDRYLSTPTPLKRFQEDFQFLVASISGRGIIRPKYKVFAQWFQHNKSLRVQGSTLEDLCKNMPPSTYKKELEDGEDGFYSRMRDTIGPSQMAKRLVTTHHGFIGMAPRRAQSGDIVCVLFGCSVPVVLRKRQDDNETWEFIGECYLHGFMEGQILERDYSSTNFILS
jgi:hypothetical protein